jgi:predicted transcriptional regulator
VRTTVTIDPDLAERLRELAHRRRKSFRAVLNEVLRQGLQAGAARAKRAPRFVVEPHAGGFRPGVDPTKLNQLLDQLDVDHRTGR